MSFYTDKHLRSMLKISLSSPADVHQLARDLLKARRALRRIRERTLLHDDNGTGLAEIHTITVNALGFERLAAKRGGKGSK